MSVLIKFLHIKLFMNITIHIIKSKFEFWPFEINSINFPLCVKFSNEQIFFEGEKVRRYFLPLGHFILRLLLSCLINIHISVAFVDRPISRWELDLYPPFFSWLLNCSRRPFSLQGNRHCMVGFRWWRSTVHYLSKTTPSLIQLIRHLFKDLDQK